MFHRFTIRSITILLFLSLIALPVLSQDDVTVPDVTGLTIPEAVARLNASGLRLGEQIAEPLTNQTQGTVAGQNIEAGSSIAYGSEIALNVYSNTRITIIYDDNDLTMLNQAGASISMDGLVFSSTDGTKRFLATGWQNELEAGDCTQIWSIARREPKQVDGCDSIFWQTTNNESEFFWTQSAGVSQFNITLNNDLVASCDAAPINTQDSPLTCEFYVVTDNVNTLASDFVYFVYTTDRFIVMNTNTDLWMPLTETPIFNFNPQISNPGASFILGDNSLFPDTDIIGDVRRLAPGQCILFTVTPLTDATAPEECHVLAQRDFAPEIAFWLANFELESPYSDNGRATCPAAVENRVTTCIMPR